MSLLKNMGKPIVLVSGNGFTNKCSQWPHLTWFSFDKFTYQVIFNGPRSYHCLGKRKNGSAGIWLETISRADLILYVSLLKLPNHGVSFFSTAGALL